MPALAPHLVLKSFRAFGYAVLSSASLPDGTIISLAGRELDYRRHAGCVASAPDAPSVAVRRGGRAMRDKATILQRAKDILRRQDR
jgi:hypothetical protein